MMYHNYTDLQKYRTEEKYRTLYYCKNLPFNGEILLKNK